MAFERFAYVHCKPDGTPFYVGKGSLKRAKYLGERNNHHKAVVEKYNKNSILIGMISCSGDEEAYLLERGLIKRLRAMGVRLSNFTSGGEGGKDPTPETRKRLSTAAKKRGISQACLEARNKAVSGKPLTREHKAKISASLRGISRTQEQKENIRKSAVKRGISRSTLEKAWQSNRGRVKPEEVKRRQAETLQATLARKKTVVETGL